MEEWPESLFAYWRARYLMEPWDWANRQALANSKYEAPKFDEPRVPDKRKRVFRKG